MERRLNFNRKTSSLSDRSISAFSESFSCGEFGAFNLDLNEDDYEAMAAEAEAEAQERINNAKGKVAVIDGDGLLDSDGDDAGEADNGGSKTRQSPPRGGTGLALLKNSRDNRSNRNNRWEPQKIFEDDGEEGEKDERDRQSSSTRQEKISQTLVIRDEDGPKRKDSINSDEQGKRNDHNSSEHSINDSVGFGISTLEQGSTSNLIKTDDKSGMVLAAPYGVPGHGIHINAPHVTINYIVEQVVESRAPATRIGGREGSFMSDGDSYASWLQDRSVSNNDNLKVESRASTARIRRASDSSDADLYASWLQDRSVSNKDHSSDSSDRSKSNFGGGVKEEFVPKIETDIQQTIHENEVPKFVTPAPPAMMSTQTEDVMPGDTTEDPESSYHKLYGISKTEEDFNASHESMTASSVWTNMSKKGGHTASTSSMSASMATRSPAAAERSALKVTKGAEIAPSEPCNLVGMLDSSWSPSNPNPSAKPNITPATMTTPPRSRSSSEGSGSGVFTAGGTSFLPAEFGGDEARGSHPDMGSLSEIARGGMPTHQTTLKFEGDHGASRGGPALSSSSSSSSMEGDGMWGGDGGQYDTQGQSSKSTSASQREAMEDDRANRRHHLNPTSTSRSTSRGKARDDNEANRASTFQEGRQGQDYSKTILRNPLHWTSEEGGMNVQRDQSRSTSRGKTSGGSNARRTPTPHEGEEDYKEVSTTTLWGEEDDNDAGRNPWISTSEGGGMTIQEGPTRGGHHVSFSDESPKKHPMRDLLPPLISSESERSLSVYEDKDFLQSETSLDFDTLPNNKIPGLMMGAISEYDDGVSVMESVASSVPEYKIDAQISDFARNFVNQFSMQEDNKQGRESLDGNNTLMREDGSDRSAIEELEAGRAPPSSYDSRRASVESARNKGPTQHKNDTKQTRSQSNGKSRLHNGVNTHHQGQPKRQGRSKSTKMGPQSNLPSEDEYMGNHVFHPPSFSRSQSAHDEQRNSPSRTRPLDRRRKHSGSSHGGQNRKYSIGDSLQSEKEIIRDSDVEKIFDLDVLDYCMVRRSGGRWTYSIVTEVNENEMKFVLDKTGSKKKIERGALLHNVRRLR